MTLKDTFLEGTWRGQILAADSLPGAFVHSRIRVLEGVEWAREHSPGSEEVGGFVGFEEWRNERFQQKYVGEGAVRDWRPRQSSEKSARP